MTSKQRAVLKTQAMQLDSIFQIGKSSLTPEVVQAVRDALKARELIKISVLKNCMDDPGEIARVLSERTGSEVVQVIGRKIVLYKQNYALEEKRKRALHRKKETAGNTTKNTAKNITKSTTRSTVRNKTKNTTRSSARNSTKSTAKGTAKNTLKSTAKSSARRSHKTQDSKLSRSKRRDDGMHWKWSER